MSTASKILRKSSDGYGFWCPGCNRYHGVFVDSADKRPGAQWTFNGNVNNPTFRPSLLVTYSDPDGSEPDERCHSYITDGQIQFLGDCTHALAGQTVPIPDWPYAEGEWSDG